MRIFGIIAIFLFSSIDLTGQHLTYFFGHKVFDAQNVCDLEYTGCDYRPLSSTSNMLAYAYHPSGDLWLILDELYDPDGYRRIKIYSTNLETCKYKLLYTINMPQYWVCNAGANVDFQGRLYLSIQEWYPVNSVRTISRIADLSNPIIERMMILKPDQDPAEMLVLKDAVYIADFNKPYIRVYDTTFKLLDTLIMPLHITGLTAVSHGCDSLTVYAAHSPYPTSEYLLIGPDTNLHISYFNLQTNTLTPICEYWMGDNAVPSWITSPLEFLASDPECDLLIDLDRDNSTGVYPYDFLDSTQYCSTVDVPICDEDTYIHTAALLDSIRLVLSGILDPGDELLTMPMAPPDVSFVKQNDSTYIITSSNRSDSIFSLALRAVHYQHNGIPHTAGVRTIIVNGFNAIKEGVAVKSFITLKSNVETFQYSTTCLSSEVDTTSIVYVGQNGCDSLVTSIVTLVPSDTTTIEFKTCDPSQVGSTEYFYINQDGCDSLVIEQYSLYPLPEVTIQIVSDFNGYGISCFGESDGEISADPSGVSLFGFEWSNGDSNQTQTGLSAGAYMLTVTDGNGCTAIDEVTLQEPNELTLSFLVSDPGCFDDNDGGIMVDAEGGIEPIQYSINGSGYQSSNVFDDLAGGTYSITALDANGCTKTEIIWINVPLMINVDLGEDEMLMEGDTTVLHAIVNLPFDSISTVTWSGLTNPDCPNCLSQPVSPIVTTTYSVSITNTIGCKGMDSLTLFLVYNQDVYIPNVFSPNGDGINDLIFINGGPGIERISSFSIFDRWGNEVYLANDFQPNDAAFAWDGKMNGDYLNPGVYVYRAIIIFKDGNSVVRYGDITLIR